MAGESQLPVSLLLWIAAILPLVVILSLLIGRHWKEADAAPVGYFVAVAIALLLFRADIVNVALQTVKGVWDAIFIAYVIAPALLLYLVAREAGAFAALQRGIEAVTPNDLLHVLAFGWVFSSFLQGVTGFGAPLAVTAPLLVAVGVKPLWAVVLPVIGHAWAKTFGTLAVAWEALTLSVTMDDPALVARIAALMLLATNALAGFAIAWLYGGVRGVREGLPAIVIFAALQGGGELMLAPLVPPLAVVVPAAVAVGAVLVLARTLYRTPSGVRDSPLFEVGAAGPGQQAAEQAVGGSRRPGMPAWLAVAPYAVLVALIGFALLVPPIRNASESVRVGLPFPALETGYGVRTEAVDAYNAFSPLTHPGTFLLIASAVAYALFALLGYLDRRKLDDVLVGTVKRSIPSVFSLFALIPLAHVLQGSGQVLELALGIGAVATGSVYALVAPFVGLIGGFLFGSNLSANILLGPLQEQTATALEIPTGVVLAAHTAGAAIGGAVAVGTVLQGIAAIGADVRSGMVIRKTLPYAAATLVIIGLISLAGVQLLGGQAGGPAPGS